MSLTDRSRGSASAEVVDTGTAATVSLHSRRTVYGRPGTPTSLPMWIFQRFSGVLLGPLVFVHVLVPSAPGMVWVSSLLLALILGHAFIGLWRVVAMRRFSLSVARSGLALTSLYILVLAVFGIALLCSL
jgi:succinate dehydrogenase hydrophobic anchor subunit